MTTYISVKELFTGDSITTTFDLKYTPISPITYVYVNDVRMYEGINFSISYLNKQITFFDIYAEGIAIVVIYRTDLEKTFEDLVADMIYYIAENQTEVTDFNEGGIVRTILEAVAYELGTGTDYDEPLYSKLTDVYNSAYVDTASGVDLENVVALVGVSRRDATSATGEVTFSRSVPVSYDIIINTGTTVSTTKSGTTDAISFATTESVTLIAGDTSVSASVQAINTGSTGNVGASSINVMTTSVAGIESVINTLETSGGLDIETDDELRARAKRALSSITKATESAITSNVLNIAGVTECVLDDLSLLEEGEEHTYTNWATSENFTLDIVPINWVKEITGTSGLAAHTFVQGTDYEITDATTGTCKWIAAGTLPDDGTAFYVTYEYYILGGFNIIVKGESSFSSDLLDEIDTTIDTIKAAGVTYTFTEPISRAIDLEVNIIIIDGYDNDTVKSNVESALIIYLQNLGIGKDVYLAKIYDIIMGISGVENTIVLSPVADLVIYECEFATDGTITVNIL